MTTQEFFKEYFQAMNIPHEKTIEERFKEFKDSLSPIGIAKHLSNIAKSQPYISYIKYAEHEFQIGRLTASRYKSVGDKFLVDYNTSVFYAEGKDFNITVLMMLLPFSVEEIDGFIRSGKLQVGEKIKSVEKKIKEGVLKSGN